MRSSTPTSKPPSKPFAAQRNDTKISGAYSYGAADLVNGVDRGIVLISLAACALSAVSSLARPIHAADATAPCRWGSLPSDIRRALNTNFRSWTIQKPDSLRERARRTWAQGNSPGCPGIAAGLFESENTPAYALLLVPAEHPDAGYMLLVFGRKVGRASYGSTVAEQYNGPGSANYFLRKIALNKFFSKQSKRGFSVQATEGIEMIDSAEQEYEVDIYFWSNEHFQHEPVDD